MEKPTISHLLAPDSTYRHKKLIYHSNASPTIIDLYEDASLSPMILKRLQKSMIFSDYQVKSALREISIHMSLKHPNIVELFDSYESPTEYLLLMEFIPKHDYFTEKIEGVIPK